MKIVRYVNGSWIHDSYFCLGKPINRGEMSGVKGPGENVRIPTSSYHSCSQITPGPGPSTQNSNVVTSKTLTLTHLISHPPNLNDTHLNSYSVLSDPLEIGPELNMDYPLDNPFNSSQRS